MSNLFYEGVSCFVASQPLLDHVALYRAWNGSDHFYTTDKSEYVSLPSQYDREGIACYIATTPQPHSESVQVASEKQPLSPGAYREIVKHTSAHGHISEMANEHPRILDEGERQVSGDIFGNKHYPLYRFYNRIQDDHLYTASEDEKNNLMQNPDWKFENIVGYVRIRHSIKHVPLYRAYNNQLGDHYYTTNLIEMEYYTGVVIPDPLAQTDLIVRTINALGKEVGNAFRLYRWAKKFHDDYPAQMGLIGMQEAAGIIFPDASHKFYIQETNGQMPKYGVNAATYLAGELADQFGTRACAVHSGGNSDVENGIVFDDNWEFVNGKMWGIHTTVAGYGAWDRKLIRVTLLHKARNSFLRFYSVHFTPGDDEEDERAVQAKQVVDIIRGEKFIGLVPNTSEYPPILVGDFNSQRFYDTGKAERSVKVLEEHFWRPIDALVSVDNLLSTGIDIIYVGKKSSFPDSRGLFRPIQRRQVSKSIPPIPGAIEDQIVYQEALGGWQISDHDSEGFAFKIE